MLKFWKKTGRKENSIDSASSSPTSTPRNQPARHPITNGQHFFTESIPIEELDRLVQADSSDMSKSRLSKTLDEVIADNEALAYFIQYLETVGQAVLIKFVLDVQSLNTALGTSGTGARRAANGSCGLEKVLNDLVVDYARDGSAGSGVGSVAARENDQRNASGVSETNSSDKGCEIRNNMDASGAETATTTTTTTATGDKGAADVCNCNGGQADLRQMEVEMFSRLFNSKDVSENVIDAVKIYHKYFSHKAPLKIELDPGVRERLVRNFAEAVNETTFAEAMQSVMKILEQEHFNDFLRSEFHCKYQIDVLTSNKVLISDILYNDTALFYFMEFLEQEGVTSLVEFWIAAYHFQLQYQERDQNYDPMEAQNDAMVLYDKFFSLQATNPLPLDDNVRIQVEESICKEEGPLPSCFDYPQKLIVKLLELEYLQPFLQSQLYCKYLSELITTIHASPVLCSRSRNSGAGSDCSSEVSISATNTLLAAEDVNPPKKVLRHLNSGSIEADSLYDPDCSLWRRRPRRTGLNFGRINELGRFETDLEPEPDRKSESRITKAVKKFVHLDEDKSKEEMAWQVAAMIVRDVTNITMPQTSAQT